MGTIGTGRPYGKEHSITLVQNGTSSPKNEVSKDAIYVIGKGTKMNNTKVLLQRAKKKTITQKVSLSLIDIAKRRGETKIEKSFWHTYHCQNSIISSNGKLFGQYCKNRFCTICCGIRKAELINRYYSTIKTWEEPYFVTITARSVPAKNLRRRIEQMLEGFNILIERNKKRHQRGKGIKLIGIKSLECNFNPIPRTYNPHFHLIVANRAMAELIVKEWLELLSKKFALSVAQKIIKVNNLDKMLIEIIKYGSKIFTRPDKEDKKRTPFVYTSALYNILAAMRGHRIFDRFGFNLLKQHKTKGGTITKAEKPEYWEYFSEIANWLNTKTNKPLSGYSMPPELYQILNYNINSEIQ